MAYQLRGQILSQLLASGSPGSFLCRPPVVLLDFAAISRADSNS